MKKYWGLFWAAALLAIVLAVLAIWADLDAQTVVGVGLGFIAFFWLIVILTVPWNLYFAARQAAHRLSAVQVREIPVSPASVTEVASLTKRLLAMAVGSHLVTAAIALVVSLAFGYVLGYYIAGFFLGSIVFRPAAAYFAYLRSRIASISQDVAYPPDDVVELRSRVRAVSDRLEALESALSSWQESDARQIDDLRDDVRRQDQRARDEQRAARESIVGVEQRMTVMVARFDAALDGVADQREIISGLRAFARLMRENPGS
ncbi:hypothetical protein JK358_15870 [Nocardia sp. 2]|uniref:Uncharacterized protein n=1 Tax=Nocardia acididurans TaxID=2802282 RepID=A0ABS1M6M4_9NOCA|nr:hypothetical protein [Nocardia acididurans]MBL1075874.1 hypothetical protein [Nocardia acididurans]